MMETEIAESIELLEHINESIIDQDKEYNEDKVLNLKRRIQSKIKILSESINELSYLENTDKNNLKELAVNILRLNTNNIDYDFNRKVKQVEIPQKYLGLLTSLDALRDELKRIDYLSVIGDKNVILIGGNGVGKSAFAAYLRDTQSDEIVVIPAQKMLFYNSSVSELYRETKNSINNTQTRNLIGEGKELGEAENYKVMNYQRDLSALFSRLITAIVNEQITEEHVAFNSSEEKISSKKSIFNRLKLIWNKLIPDIDFKIDTVERLLIPQKNGITYNINSMSDGEKAILFYICQVLLAKKNSYIIVDEPETFLNISTYSRLWDYLENERDDCRIIYISHNIDFIVTRTNIDLLWCKEFTYPNKWDLKRIRENDEISNRFPKQLLTEILGVRKPILFCEGTKEGLDFAIYNSLFNDRYVICPVGGHNEVIQYVRAYNNSPILNGNQAYGLIDGDWMEEEQIIQYKNEGIFTIYFNEIEMILLTDEVMKSVLENVYTEEVISNKLSNFKKDFFGAVNLNKEKIINTKIKRYLDYQLSKFRINDKDPKDNFEGQVTNWLSSLEIENKRYSSLCQLDEVINKQEYLELLKISSQKKEISKGLANKILDSDYETKAINRLRISPLLREELKNIYFSNVLSNNEIQIQTE